MYEARRQRSSWARIKLSIVRKLCPLVYPLPQINRSNFVLSLSFASELTSSSSSSIYSVFNVRWLPGSGQYLLFIFALFNVLWVYFRAQSCDYLLQLSSLRPQVRFCYFGQLVHTEVSSPHFPIILLQFPLSTLLGVHLVIIRYNGFSIWLSMFIISL